QPGERTRLDPYRVRSQFRRDVGGAREQEVTDQDGDGVAPAGVGARGAPAYLGLVHHVVVVERGQVGQLDDDTRENDIEAVARPELCRDRGQPRSEPLTARVDPVPGRLRA